MKVDNTFPFDLTKDSLKNRDFKIMTHLVAGYPSFEKNLSLLKLMEEHKVDMVEIQIPFSEPIADGKTITRANQKALANGITLNQVLTFIQQARSQVKIPFLIMTYYNIIFQFGLEKFFKKCCALGINGLIVPDIPFDESRENYFSMIKNYDVIPIIVISPTTEESRLETIIRTSSEYNSFIYATLKVGITGSKKNLNKEGVKYLALVKKKIQNYLQKKNVSNLPLAAGFGLSSKKQIQAVGKEADIVVVGSYIIDLFDKEGISGVRDFLTMIS